ncbi:MAG TPA: TraB/GumN family protein [Luteimonas sp.]|nr:TraB/GumN family protein [Luteimonas sp.]
MTARTRIAALLLPVLLAATAPAAAAEPPVPLLWKVSDADNSLYLLGSFHVLRADDHPLSPDVDAAFADAESLLFEMAPEEIASPTLALRMGQAALREDGSTLSASLPPATVAKLQRWLQEKGGALAAAGLPPDAVERFEPWYVGLLVSTLDMAGLGLDPELGLDRYFGTRATQAGKPTAGLETAEQQIAFLDGMDAGEQLQFLGEALDNSLEGNDELEQLHAAWRAGDADGLWNGLAAEMRQRFPDLYRHINVERNDAWLPMLEQRLQAPGEDDTLVVVGALHLLGEDGLVHKLRERGYNVERICSACNP